MRLQLKNVVLADDDREDIEIFQLALEETCPDIKLAVAEDGDDLLHLLSNTAVPDLIVLDINMPRKSGRECLKEIRSQKIYDGVPVIILSTSSHKDDISYCLSMGANRYFTKPPNFAEVKKLVEEICEGNL
jgi:CheY-like chemotaxis protein